MNSCSTVTYQVQTGIWDKPQIISFDSLFTTYSVETVFESDEMARMAPVLTKWKDLASNHFSIPKIWDRPIIASYVSKTPTITRRTAHVELPETPGIIFKTYCPNSSCHPMATTLRSPMASLVQGAICDAALSRMGVPKKGLFPLFSKEVISELNEKSINEAFIVCVEKIDVFTPQKTREQIKDLSTDSQKELANQCCEIPKRSGLTDFMWENLQMHKGNKKLYVLDTETLSGDLFIDKFEKGFESCAEAINECPLSSRAKAGLVWFQQSSNVHQLEIFENMASSHLEKMD